MELTLGMHSFTMRVETGLGQLAQTIKNIAENYDKPPETKISEPYSERMTIVAEYIQQFNNEKARISGYKINQEVLPLDVLGIYLIRGRRADQIQIVFEQKVDTKAVGEALKDNPETEKLEVNGKCIKEGTRVLAIMDGKKFIITTGKTSPAFAKVLAAIETIYHSGAFVESSDTETEMHGIKTEAVGTANVSSAPSEMKLEQRMDLRLEARLTIIQTIEGTIRPEMKMELRQMLAMRHAPIMKASTDEIRDALADQTEQVRREYKAAMRKLAGRIMRETPATARPKDFGAAIKIAYRMVRSGLKKQASGG